MTYPLLPHLATTLSIAEKTEQTLAAEPWLAATYIAASLIGIIAFMSLMGLGLVYAERKVAAHFQCRLGPMRVGWHGTLQTIADAIKLVMKEDTVPTGADRALFFIAPVMSILATVLALIVIPFAPGVQIIDLEVGVLYLAAVSGFGVLGILLGGWSSNNKWSLLGAMRSGAQFVSYEISVTISLLIVSLFAGSMQLSEIVASQESGWWIWRGHLPAMIGFLILLIASTAEINRAPFDLPEAESELTGGFHTEFSGIRFAFFFLAEYINMFITAAIAATLFLGGWMPLHIGTFETFNMVMDFIPPIIWFLGKTAFLIFVMMWVRWTFPRLRVDQLMRLEWKVLVPVSFANLLLCSLIIFAGLYFFPGVK